jgi:hypothetical protein
MNKGAIAAALLDYGVASPMSVARGFFYGFLTLAVAGLVAFVIGLCKIRRERVQVTKTQDQLIPTPGQGRKRDTRILARTKGVSAEFSESLPIRDLLPGLKIRDPQVIGFALRAGGLVVFVLSTFLALGTGRLVYAPAEEDGWVFIGFVVFFVSVMGYRIATAPDDDPKQ